MLVQVAFIALVLNLGFIAPVLSLAGGNTIHWFSMPYNVALMFDKNNTDTNLCGGSLIKEDLILTSADCVDNASSVKVTLGAYNITNPTEPSQVIVTATEFIKHPDFNSTSMQNNVALVRLSEKVSLKKEIQLIELSQETQIRKIVGKDVVPSGWGSMDPLGGWTSQLLLRLDVFAIDNVFCEMTWHEEITDKNLCTEGSPNGHIDLASGICTGDHGDPVVYEGKQIAIGSYGYGTRGYNGTIGTCTNGKPSVWTLVGPFYDWIQSQMS